MSWDLVRQARESPDREICGFVLDDGATLRIDNVSENDSHFQMHPDQQLACQQEYGDRIIGVYHSHPSGNMDPSWSDVLHTPEGMNCIIVTTRGWAEWVISSDKSSVTLARPKTVVDGVPRIAEARRPRCGEASQRGS